MKGIYALVIALLISGCIKKPFVEFSGTVPGVKSGVFIIKTLGDSSVFGENVKDGKFTTQQKLLKEPGYYMMNITDDANDDNHSPFEVYLENGKYEIETEAGKLYKYPQITSSSKIQQQLSAFYTLSDKLSSEGNLEVSKLNKEVKNKGNTLSPSDYSALINQLSAAEIKVTTNNIAAFNQFVKLYPESDISCHLMSKLSYEDDPVAFYKIYQALSPAARNTDEGKEIGDKLSHLIKLIPGAKAPEILGKTPDGKPFNPASLHKKLFLVDFWRAGNDFSRVNHQTLVNILSSLGPDGFGVISVSLDSKMDWWTKAIADDNLTWTQVSDLKGDDSPNAVNWSISKIPTYYLVDGNWNIVARDIDMRNVSLEVGDYLKKNK